ncbi:MAG: phosphoribulokinase [Methanosaeta sp. PtaB.Bin087]|nr:MAG: phosphoribulokinase [Methanosaeta sp. PtaB.Bin087]
MALSLAERLKGSGRVFVVAVAGDSGSGKTTLSQGIRRLLGDDLVSTFSMDDYHSLDREERRIRAITPLNPAANRLDLLAEHLGALRRSEEIDKPVYDHTDGTIKGPVPFRSAPVLIIEGLHPFYTPELRREIDLKIFVDPSRAVKRRWKMKRDCVDRHYEREAVMAEILAREPDYKLYVDVQKIYAEAVVKIEESRLLRSPMAEDPPERYSVRLIQEVLEGNSSEVDLKIDLSALFRLAEREFSIAFQRDDYYGKRVSVLTIDGELHRSMIEGIEEKLCSLLGSEAPICDRSGDEEVSATGMVQILLCWRLLEKLQLHLAEIEAAKTDGLRPASI